MDARFTELLRPFLKNAGPEVVITPDTDLRRLGVDSMQAIELLFSVEDAFAISLPDEELNDTTFATAGSLWRVISAQLPDGAAGRVGA
ncbi:MULTISPECIES: phosphopantetheine-binding protein [unclassified Streptomyces]|uniref:phosphopantetheine-binding protein n=1 Tax=unclassified Streptomyces TaxID=2593676 RepID=UPI002E14E0E8|nr:phosphopantetheine-binding protein [Streptomyces sp. NBC_01197]WSS47880.1 phosphopantetheine-binding protein [Streptomyces sp. NBC_01180]